LQDNVRGSINSFGGGIIAVIAVVLKILFNIVTKRFPLLVFDETLSFLAVNYIPAMSEFLKTLSKEFNIPILLVTHQKEFAIAAENCFEISLDKEGNTIINQE
jgi:ABC-type dipeptide/oligopeptide/nickel transport system ATPase subunit